MFGTFRFLLALLVVLSHLWPRCYWMGHFAVFAFYSLSGYLMTLILHTKYGFTSGGLVRFAINRFIRIYPGYWAAVLLAIVVISIVGPGHARDFKESMFFPTGKYDALTTVTLLGLKVSNESRLIPPAWALNIELTYYILIALVLGRSAKTAASWFGLSLFVTVWLVLKRTSFEDRYFTIVGASLPFSIGALIYYLPRWSHTGLGGSACAVFALNLALPFAFPEIVSANFLHPGNLPLYASLLLSSAIIWWLTTLDAKTHPFRKWDRWLGNLSYPIYLIHWPVACLVWFVFHMPLRSFGLFALATPFVLLAASMLWALCEKPFERVRGRVATAAKTY